MRRCLQCCLILSSALARSPVAGAAPDVSSAPAVVAPAASSPPLAHHPYIPPCQDPEYWAKHPWSLELGVGPALRLSDAGGYSDEGRAGAAYGAALWLRPFESAALGLEIERVGLGSGSAERGATLVEADYSATNAWLAGRFSPFARRYFETFLALRVGLGFQHLSSRGVREGSSGLAAPQAFSCSESDDPAFALGAGFGVSWALGRRVSLVTRVDAESLRLSGDVLGACGPGVGGTTLVALGLGAAYGFD